MSRKDLPADESDDEPALDEPAGDLCAEITRGVLGDFAPAMLLLPGTERRRAQALVAYAHTPLRFRPPAGLRRGAAGADQPLGADAGGGACGPSPWTSPSSSAWRGRTSAAAGRWTPSTSSPPAPGAAPSAASPRPSADAEVGALSLGRAVASALLEKSLNAEVDGLGERPRPPLVAPAPGRGGERPALPPAGQRGPRRRGRRLGPGPARRRPRAASARGCADGCCAPPAACSDLPHGYRRAAVFSLLAALRLLTEIEDPEADLLNAPPRLGVGSRLGFLLRARLGR